MNDELFCYALLEMTEQDTLMNLAVESLNYALISTVLLALLSTTKHCELEENIEEETHWMTLHSRGDKKSWIIEEEDLTGVTATSAQK